MNNGQFDEIVNRVSKMKRADLEDKIKVIENMKEANLNNIIFLAESIFKKYLADPNKDKSCLDDLKRLLSETVDTFKSTVRLYEGSLVDEDHLMKRYSDFHVNLLTWFKKSLESGILDDDGKYALQQEHRSIFDSLQLLLDKRDRGKTGKQAQKVLTGISEVVKKLDFTKVHEATKRQVDAILESENIPEKKYIDLLQIAFYSAHQICLSAADGRWLNMRDLLAFIFVNDAMHKSMFEKLDFDGWLETPGITFSIFARQSAMELVGAFVAAVAGRIHAADPQDIPFRLEDQTPPVSEAEVNHWLNSAFLKLYKKFDLSHPTEFNRDVESLEYKFSHEIKQYFNKSKVSGQITTMGQNEAGKDKTLKVFISYSHDSDEHKKWVLNLAIKLCENGIDVVLDQWDLKLGGDLAKFMESSTDVDRVLMICTEQYVKKADIGKGGVGYEAMIVNGELLHNLDTTKFIPVIRQKSGEIKLPKSVSTRLYIDLSNDQSFEQKFERLLRELHQVPVVSKPPLGENPFITKPSDADYKKDGQSNLAQGQVDIDPTKKSEDDKTKIIRKKFLTEETVKREPVMCGSEPVVWQGQPVHLDTLINCQKFPVVEEDVFQTTTPAPTSEEGKGAGGGEREEKEIIEIKPGLWGISVDLKEVWRRLRKIFRRKV